MARKPGVKAKAKQSIEDFIAGVEEECGQTLIQLYAAMVKDRKTRPGSLPLLMHYRYGKPKELVTHSGSITVYDAVAKARARVLQFEHARQNKETPQLLPVLPARIS